ncbi:MAG TPA: type I glyceraldehyde-3-phosphate dehydrogenase [Chloroflexota bacterium]|jgi:glyceraldehyde 3-phosphate dehydrogenase|nr:type I glyceraldehyde-3-phosphate dehydrogenase [Chloroflexota bacterium]
MKRPVGINGFGRIGRIALRTILERYSDELEVVAINDIGDASTNAYLFRYDSTYGPFPGEVDVARDAVIVNGHPIRVFAERDPAQISWSTVDAELVIESTGRFTDATQASSHLGGTVGKVIISAPAKNEDLTIVLGVNEEVYDPEKHHVVSNASCTTNGLAPVAKILNDQFGILKGLLTTVHSYTNSQQLLDLASKDLRDSRSGAMNIVPSTTGAAKAVGLVIPELQGRFTGMSFRVPTPTVSVVDFTAQLGRAASVDEINGAMRDAAGTARLKDILAYSDQPLVSMDLKKDSHSSIFSAIDTIAIDDMVKVIAWYDNEWGYACRIADLAHFMLVKQPSPASVT